MWVFPLGILGFEAFNIGALIFWNRVWGPTIVIIRTPSNLLVMIKAPIVAFRFMIEALEKVGAFGSGASDVYLGLRVYVGVPASRNP